MFDDFTTQVQSDENWVEMLIHMENLNRLMNEKENFAPSSSGLGQEIFIL